ncbi:uncharacterized protein CLAFUR5_14578 [Fulvia fulva]|uniref:Uncharacterized protein n=1 Tax=Passalora fulva TaxID=5499 RepID=A0A9Q8PMH8_PASFU|nr:uncharacterized protein CLAFUR5_14578 [Fulvia fulva]UJO25251.1 hypothetical protein CLAFUR5_14578 [Fulvia fulva]
MNNMMFAPLQPQSEFGKRLLANSEAQAGSERNDISTTCQLSPLRSSSRKAGRPRPLTLLDLPGELRNRIWAYSCGYLQLDLRCMMTTAERIAQACPEVRTELQSMYYENHIFMFNLRNLQIGRRVPTWRTWMAGIQNEDASRLKNLVFYFPDFMLKASITPAPLAKDKKLRVDFDFRPNETDSINRPYPPWLKHAADSRLDVLSEHLCAFGNMDGRLGRWGVDRIAKIAFGMVAWMHLGRIRHDYPILYAQLEDDELTYEEEMLRHGWTCGQCEWACEMTGVLDA